MKIFLALLLAIFSNTSIAQHSNELTSFTSKLMTKSPDVAVSLPSSYGIDKSKHYPVLYILDGDINEILVTSMLNRLHISNGANEHIVVGITSKDRVRDFAPTVNLDPRGPVGEGWGGDTFLDFLESELMPTINKKYRTSNHNVIAGHSIAGLLVIHAFHSRPKLFQAHLAFSPAVWWGARETLKAAQKHVSAGKDSSNFLYMNIGSEGVRCAVYMTLSDEAC